MRNLLLTGLILLQYANSAVHAADQFLVRAPRVNVRAAPNLESKILTKLSRGKVVRRIGKRGMWTKVHIDSKIPLAWIYSPLLSRRPSPFKRFQQDYARLNRNARAAGRTDLFSKVHNDGNNVLYVETGTVWNTLSATEQTAYIESLYRSWKKVHDGKPVTLHFFDGQTHRLKSDLPP